MSLTFYEGGKIWKKRSAYKPGQPLTEQKLKEVEKVLGFSLPQSYINHMYEQNGGELAYRYVLFPDEDATVIPFLHEIDLESGIGLSPVFVEACQLPEEIVLITGNLDTWIALDYRKRLEEPEVTYFFENEDDGKWEEHQIASTFEQFTRRLFQKVSDE